MLLLSLLLAAAPLPLKVRVLQQEKPYQVMLSAESLSCDGRPLAASTVAVSLKDRRLQAADQRCDVVTALGDVGVELDDKTVRRYPGRLTAVAEGAFIRFLDEVDVEDYLPGVVATEVGAAPAAAAEVQAVVSRTYALASRGRHKDEGYDLCDLAHCQLWLGSGSNTAASDEASKRTRGEVLLWGGIGLKPVYFQPACGGHTSRATDVFGDGAAGAGPPVSDTAKEGPLCRAAPDFSWTFEVERTALARALGLAPDGHAFEPLRRDAAGRVLELKAFGKRYRGSDFLALMTRLFGPAGLRSMKVSAAEVEQVLRFTGTGAGHGVGLCQHGARAMAEAGATRKQILLKYFPDCQVRVP